MKKLIFRSVFSEPAGKIKMKKASYQRQNANFEQNRK